MSRAPAGAGGQTGKLVIICFHNVNICRAARGTRRGAHVKGAGSGIDLERGGRGGRGWGTRGAGRVLRRLPYVRAQRVWHPVYQHSPTLINKTTVIDLLQLRYHRIISLMNPVIIWGIRQVYLDNTIFDYPSHLSTTHGFSRFSRICVDTTRFWILLLPIHIDR